MPSLSNIKKVARQEKVPLKKLQESVKNGESIIVTSKRGIPPLGIGKHLRSKFACIVGTSTSETSVDAVIRKAKIAVEHGASVIHNGSVGGDVLKIRKKLLKAVTVPLAICHPIGVMAEACFKKTNFLATGERDFIEQVRRDMEDNIEIILLPLGMSKKLVDKLPESKRIMPCCSKSGAIMAAWMAYNKKENPYQIHFDEILDMAKKNGTTLSVVGAFRSGCIDDALDEVQYEELKIIKKYVDRARKAGVQIKAGSGGHLPAEKIAPFFRYQKKLFKVPVISFGPQVTDISLGYDHISSAMGQLIALMSGADIFFTVTPSEHISMPDEDETRQGCIAAKIAAHSADIARGMDTQLDLDLSKAREKLDWREQRKFTLDKSVDKKLRLSGKGKKQCSVCGDSCAFQLVNSFIKNTKREKGFKLNGK